MKRNTENIIKYLFITISTCACEGDLLFRTKPCDEGMVRRGSVCVSILKNSHGDCKDVDLSKVQKGSYLTMCDGSLGEGRLELGDVVEKKVPLCQNDGEVGCLATSSFKVINTTAIDPNNIAIGTNIAGIRGLMRGARNCRNYSSLAVFDSSYPPSNLGTGVITFLPTAVTTATDQLDLGMNHGLITNSPIRFTSSGIMPSPLLANTTYYAIYVSNTVIQLASNPNGTQIDLTSQGTGTHTAHDANDGMAQYYDTVEDNNLNQSFSPLNNPWNSSDYLCDASNFINVTSNVAPFLPSGLTPSTANQPFTQIWQNQITGQYISNILYNAASNNRNWSDAIRTCESLNGGTAGDGWRLPTQKELMQFYIHGISKVAFDGGSTNNYFWSATSNSGLTSQAWHVNIAAGFLTGYSRASFVDSVLCVRGG